MSMVCLPFGNRMLAWVVDLMIGLGLGEREGGGVIAGRARGRWWE